MLDVVAQPLDGALGPLSPDSRPHTVQLERYAVELPQARGELVGPDRPSCPISAVSQPVIQFCGSLAKLPVQVVKLDEHRLKRRTGSPPPIWCRSIFLRQAIVSPSVAAVILRGDPCHRKWPL